jgi:hypothetical protein
MPRRTALKTALGFVVVFVLALVLAIAAARWWWPAASPPPAAAPQASSLATGRVSAAPGGGPLPDAATVVVFAYALEGGQAPLAVWRGAAKDLPLEFRLELSLHSQAATAREFVVGARLGPGAEALAQVGDWLAASQKAAAGAQGLQLVLQPPPR